MVTAVRVSFSFFFDAHLWCQVSRTIQDGVRTIEDTLEFAKFTDCSGILLAIDFESAFDWLNHSFLFKVVEKFNFGPYFLQSIKTFFQTCPVAF